jgi:hypothetical protein
MKNAMLTKVLLTTVFILLPLVLSGSAGAVVLGEQMYFKIAANGPLSVSESGTVKLNLEIINKESVSMSFSSITVIVIDPFTGDRVFGPQTFSSAKTVPASGAVGVNITFGPFNSVISTKNKTLAAIITIQDTESLGGTKYSVVRGSTGWGFVTTQ